MGRKVSGMKWEKSTLTRPVHNLLSSDFSKYIPYRWKYLEGPARMDLVLSYEYQRMWREELEAWKTRMYPANEETNKDIVGHYVATFKNKTQKVKELPKPPFTMKKFKGIKGTNVSKRSKEELVKLKLASANTNLIEGKQE